MHCGVTYPVRVVEIDTVMVNCRQNRVATIRLHLLSGACSMVMLSRHLRQQTVTKAERRKSEAAKFITLQQFGVDCSTCNHNFGASYANSLHFASFFQRESCEHLGNAPHL